MFREAEREKRGTNPPATAVAPRRRAQGNRGSATISAATAAAEPRHKDE